MLFYLPSNFGGESIAHFAFVLRCCRCLEPEGQQEREQRHDPEHRRCGLHTMVPGLGVDAHDLLLDLGRHYLVWSSASTWALLTAWVELSSASSNRSFWSV